MVGHSFAESVIRDTVRSVGKTVYTNIAVVGLNKDGTDNLAGQGVPGYIEMTAVDGSVFYLWVDLNGRLNISSQAIVSTAGGTPSETGWSGASGVIVGQQSYSK